MPIVIPGPVGGAQFNFVDTLWPSAKSGQAAMAIANDAVLQLVRVGRPLIVTKFRFFPVSNAGNVDVGIYSSDGTTATRLWSSTSTALAPGAPQTITISPSLAMSPGIDYYLVIAVDNNTSTIGYSVDNLGATSTVANQTISFATSFPLPATFTLASGDVTSRRYWLNAAVS